MHFINNANDGMLRHKRALHIFWNVDNVKLSLNKHIIVQLLEIV